MQDGKLLKVLLSQNEFMQIFQDNIVHYADIFMPGGGRPATINENNWQRFFADGKPAFRAIVEGANSYITPGAQSDQQNGVWIVRMPPPTNAGLLPHPMKFSAV